MLISPSDEDPDDRTDEFFEDDNGEKDDDDLARVKDDGTQVFQHDC